MAIAGVRNGNVQRILWEFLQPYCDCGKNDSSPFPNTPEAVCKKPFKDCSKTVHILVRGMRYTEYVDEGSRKPESTAYRSFISLLPPFLFCEMTGSAPIPFPPRIGVFSCLRLSAQWKSRYVSAAAQALAMYKKPVRDCGKFGISSLLK